MSNPEMTLNEKTKSMKQDAVLLDYKQTEVGIIPRDWLVLDIATTMKLINGYGFKPSQWKKEGLPIIRIQNLNDANAPYNYFPGVIDKKFHVKKGDLLFAWSGSKGVSFGARVWQGKRAILNQHIFKIIPNENFVTVNYSYYVLRKVQEQIEKMAHGFKSSFVHVKKGDLENTPLPIPPKKEQTAIANVLSDTDALIAELEKLIAKKQAIKTAIMQQLLTGRTRLPQFSKNPDGTIKGYKSSELGHIPEDWEVVKLKDVCFFENGDRSSNYPTPDSFVESGIPFINAGHIGEGIINQRGMNFITYKAFEKLGGGKVKPNDILFCLRGSLGKFGIVPDNFGIGAIASSLVIIRTKQQILLLDYFASGYLKSSICEDMIELWAGGAAQPNLGARELGNFLLPLPSVSEQRSIATILSDMDAELTTLEQKLDKFLDIKQGMMQQLLTGRIRLPLEQQP